MESMMRFEFPQSNIFESITSIKSKFVSSLFRWVLILSLISWISILFIQHRFDNTQIQEQKHLILINNSNNQIVNHKFSINKSRKPEILNVVVINLPYRIIRWKTITKHFHQSQIMNSSIIKRHVGTVGKELNLIDLYNTKIITDGAYRSLLYPRTVGGHFMTAGGLGCSMSHFDAWKYCITLGKPLIVFEDDIILLPTFDIEFSQILNELPSTFGLFYFADVVHSEKSRKASHPYSPMLHRLSGEHWGMFAYMISPAAAKILYDAAFPIHVQIDSYLIEMSKLHSIEVYRAKKNLVYTRNDKGRPSDVQMFESTDGGKIFPAILHVIPAVWNTSLIEFEHDAEVIFDTPEKEMNSKHQIMTWNTTMMISKLSSNSISFLNNTSKDHSLYPFHVLILQLNILYEFGGIFVNPSSHTKFPIGKAFKGLNGFVGYEFSKKTQTYKFPLIGGLPGLPVYKKLIESIQIAIDNKFASSKQISFTIFKAFKEFGSTMHLANTFLIFPMSILSEDNTS